MISYLSGQQPSLPELLRLNLHHAIGNKYKTFGILLLNDTKGLCLNEIEDEYFGNTEYIIMKVFQKWLMGHERAATWLVLVETLRECRLPALANQIEKDKIESMYICDTHIQYI